MLPLLALAGIGAGTGLLKGLLSLPAQRQAHKDRALELAMSPWLGQEVVSDPTKDVSPLMPAIGGGLQGLAFGAAGGPAKLASAMGSGSAAAAKVAADGANAAGGLGPADFFKTLLNDQNMFTPGTGTDITLNLRGKGLPRILG